MAVQPLVTFLLRQADDNLVICQRLGELISRMPDLEEDIAIANRSLDHLGQARALYGYAAELLDDGRSEDDLAMCRSERDFTNSVLVEQPNGDFAQTMARQLFLDAYQLPFYQRVASSGDVRLGGIAAKAVKEAQYHLRHSSAWVVRLGDGTEESHRRMQAGIEAMWPFSADLFSADDVEVALATNGVLPSLDGLRAEFDTTIESVLATAGLQLPDDDYQRVGGRAGFHTEHLGHLLPEMQGLYRNFEGATW